MDFKPHQKVLIYLRDFCVVPTALALQVEQEIEFQTAFEAVPSILDDYVSKRVKGHNYTTWAQWMMASTFTPVTAQCQEMLSDISREYGAPFVWIGQNKDLSQAIDETIHRIIPAIVTPTHGAITEIFTVWQKWEENLGTMFWVVNTPQHLHGKTTQNQWFAGNVTEEQVWIKEPSSVWFREHSLQLAVCATSGGMVLRNVYYPVSETPDFQNFPLVLPVRALAEGE